MLGKFIDNKPGNNIIIKLPKRKERQNQESKGQNHLSQEYL